jgi:hypothetical protein
MHHLLRDEEGSLRVCRVDLVGQNTHPERVGVAPAILGSVQDWNV